MAWVVPNVTPRFGAHFPHSELLWPDPIAEDNQAIYQSSKAWSFGGGMLSEDERPYGVQLKKSYKSLNSAFHSESRFLVAQQPLLDVLLELEGDALNYWPIEVLSKDGIPFDVPCYGIIPHGPLQTIIVEKSRVSIFDGDGLRLEEEFGAKNPFDIVIDGTACGGAHIWVERKTLGQDMMISDQLDAAIKEHGLKFFKRFHVREA